MVWDKEDPHISFNDQDNPRERSTLLKNRYWISYEGRLITHRMDLRRDYYAPQCNERQDIVLEIQKRLYPWAEVIFVKNALVYLGVN